MLSVEILKKVIYYRCVFRQCQYQDLMNCLSTRVHGIALRKQLPKKEYVDYIRVSIFKLRRKNIMFIEKLSCYNFLKHQRYFSMYLICYIKIMQCFKTHCDLALHVSVNVLIRFFHII